MKRLSTGDFCKYMGSQGERFIWNPRVNVAFRTITEDGKDRYFAKGEGQREIEIKSDDEDYNEAWEFSIIMLKEEYDEY